MEVFVYEYSPTDIFFDSFSAAQGLNGIEYAIEWYMCDNDNILRRLKRFMSTAVLGISIRKMMPIHSILENTYYETLKRKKKAKVIMENHKIHWPMPCEKNTWKIILCSLRFVHLHFPSFWIAFGSHRVHRGWTMKEDDNKEAETVGQLEALKIEIIIGENCQIDGNDLPTKTVNRAYAAVAGCCYWLLLLCI